MKNYILLTPILYSKLKLLFLNSQKVTSKDNFQTSPAKITGTADRNSCTYRSEETFINM